MKIMEVYRTIQGEGLSAGCPTVFIRTAGCSVKCPQCDTVPSWRAKNRITDTEEVSPSTVADIVQTIDSCIQYVCLTGGEPLEQNVTELVDLTLSVKERLPRLRHFVLETSGAFSLSSYLRKLKAFCRTPNRPDWLSISMDWKPPSTGITSRMLLDNYTHLTTKDIIKCVCTDVDDVDASLIFLQKIKGARPNTRCAVFFHAMGGKAESWLAKVLLDRDLSWTYPEFDIRFGCQLHTMVGMR